MKFSEIIIFFPSIEKGGADKNLFMISNFLSKKFTNVSILTCSNKYKSRFKKLKYIGPNSNFFENFGRSVKSLIAIYYLIKIIFSEKNILVLSLQSNIFSVIVCKIFSVKIITRSNSFPNDWTNNILKKFIFKTVYNLADLTIVNSVEVKKKFKKFYNINSAHIYNPVQKSKILFLSKNKIKNMYKYRNSLKIIMVGRLSIEKDHNTFLESLKILSNKIKIESIILGSGNQKERIENTILQLNLKKIVKIISFKKNPYPYIKNSDILVLTSLHEGLPNILIESTVLKTFIISSDCETGPKEILLNGKAGALFKVGDSQQLADKIIYYYNNHKQKNKMIKLGFKSLHRFDYLKNLNKYYNKIKDCLIN